ncbi:hypothetical protein PAMP_003493 [Pampus punctatissimus]
MLTQLVLGWTALLSGFQPVAPSITTRFPSSRWSVRKCQVFIPPPLPPPLFPPIKRKADLMGEKGNRGWRGLYGDIGTPGMIKGDKGVKGDRGLSGEMGERGIAGEPGEKGDPGQRGKAGPKGEQGPRGEPGDRGNMGLKGYRGPTGKLGDSGPVGLPGLTGEPGRPGRVYILPGLQGDTGSQGPLARCNCSQVQTPQGQWDKVQTIFIADGEKQMRRLRGQNVMVLRTDRQALYIYAESQWINVLEAPRH